MARSPLSSSEYQAVELAIQTTGQAGLQSLERELNATKSQIQAFQSQLAAGHPLNAQAVSDLAGLAQAHERLQASVDAANRVLAGQPANLQATQSGFNGAARAALEFSRGLEDFATGGFLGALNNIPRVAAGIGEAFKLSAPQVALLETAVSLVGTAAYVAAPKIKAAYQALDQVGNVAVPAGEATDVLKGKIKELEKALEAMQKRGSLRWYEADEYRKMTADVAAANKELERQKDLKAQLSGRSKAQREAGSAFDEAVAESGGDLALRGLVSRLMDQADARGLVFNEQTRTMTTPQRAGEDLFREAGRGDTVLRDRIVEILGPNSQFAAKIRELSPETKAAREKAEELDRKAKEVISDVGDSVREAVLKPLVDAARAGQDLNRVAAGMRGNLAAAFGSRGAPKDVAGRAADLFLEDQRHEALNLRATGGMTPAEKKEAAAKEADLKSLVSDLKAGFVGPLVEQLAKVGRAGGNLDEAAEGLKAGLTRDIQGRGVAAEKSGEVAARLLQEALADARNVIQRGGQTPGERKAASDRKKAVDDAAGGYAGTDQAEAELFTRARMGEANDQAGADRVRASIRAGIVADLARGNTPADVAGDAADKIIAKIDDAVAKHIANGTEPTAVRRVSQGRKQAANRIDDAYLGPIEASIAANRLAQAQGAPVVRSAKEEAAFRQAGQPYALPEVELGQRLQRDASQRLRAGGQDPSLAGDLVQRGFEAVGERTTQALANTATIQQALADVVGGLARRQEAILQQQAAVAQNVRAIRQQQNQFRMRRPAVGAQWFGPMGVF